MPNKPRELDELDRDLYALLDDSQSRETITELPGAWSDLASRGLVTIAPLEGGRALVRARKANRRRKREPFKGLPA